MGSLFVRSAVSCSNSERLNVEPKNGECTCSCRGSRELPPSGGRIRVCTERTRNQESLQVSPAGILGLSDILCQGLCAMRNRCRKPCPERTFSVSPPKGSLSRRDPLGTGEGDTARLSRRLIRLWRTRPPCLIFWRKKKMVKPSLLSLKGEVLPPRTRNS